MIAEIKSFSSRDWYMKIEANGFTMSYIFDSIEKSEVDPTKYMLYRKHVFIGKVPKQLIDESDSEVVNIIK